MFEYKILQSKFSFTGNAKKFEELVNSQAREGWKVIGFTNESGQFFAMLERSKNR